MANGNLSINVTVNGAEDIARLTKEFEKLKALVGEGNVTVETQEYRLVTNRGPIVGDFVKFDEAPYTHLTAKEYYEIIEIDGCDDPQVIDDDGDEYDTAGDSYEVYERVSDESPKDDSLKVGDYAKVINKIHEFDVDNIVKIVGDEARLFDFKVEYVNVTGKSKCTGQTLGYIDAKNIIKATDEEVANAKEKQAQAKDELEFAKFSKGDKVRLLNGGGDYPLNGFSNGEICTVKEPKHYHGQTYGYMVQITDSNWCPGYAKPHQLEKVTAEEVAKLEAKQAEQARWAKIGRKPNEFKKGDIVRDRDYGFGIVDEIEPEGYMDSSRGLTLTSGEWTYKHHCELITPVEQRFDLAQGASA